MKLKKINANNFFSKSLYRVKQMKLKIPRKSRVLGVTFSKYKKHGKLEVI